MRKVITDICQLPRIGPLLAERFRDGSAPLTIRLQAILLLCSNFYSTAVLQSVVASSDCVVVLVEDCRLCVRNAGHRGSKITPGVLHHR